MAVLIQGDAWFSRAEHTEPSRYCCVSSIVRRNWKVLLILLLLAAVSKLIQAQVPPTEYEVKAAFIYNFAKFVEWPAGSFSNPSASLQLCVLGNDPLLTELEAIVAGKSIGSRSLQVRHVEILRIKDCHVLFVASAETYSLQQAVHAAQGASILTIGDTSGFLNQGG